ncbi:Zinc finger MYM-type protein 1, partial [Araneus ventricosus]
MFTKTWTASVASGITARHRLP